MDWQHLPGWIALGLWCAAYWGQALTTREPKYFEPVELPQGPELIVYAESDGYVKAKPLEELPRGVATVGADTSRATQPQHRSHLH